MGSVTRSALVVLVLTACGKGGEQASSTGGGTAGPATTGSAAASGSAGSAAIDPLRTVVVTEVAATARVDAVPPGPLVVASTTAIVVEGTSMAAVSGGRIDAAAVSSSGRITSLTSWAEAWVKVQPAAPPRWVRVAVEPTLPATLLTQLVGSFTTVGQRDFALVVRTPDGPGSIALRLPEAPVARDEATPPDVAPAAPPLQLVLGLSASRAMLWSISGLEGTLGRPKLTLTPAAGGAWLGTLRGDLAEIVARRWSGRARPPSEQTIVIMVDDSLVTADLVAALVAVRHDGDGNPLFPDVQLALGFDTKVADARPPIAPPGASPSEASAVLLQEEAAQYLAALAGSGDSGGDLSADMARARPGSDLGAQLDQVRESGAAVSVGSHGTRGDGEARTGLGSGPRIGDGPATVGDEARGPRGRISVSGKQALDDTDLPVDKVLSMVLSRYLGGLKRCYSNVLKADPTVRGKVELSFTVNEAGRVTARRAKAPTAELGTCVERLMSSWRFPAPKDDDGEPTEASFVVFLQVIPD